MNRPSARSFISIDIARAMAALGVFYYHQHIGSLLAKYSGVEWLKLTDSFGASYAVPLFFLISGYCIHLSNLKYVRAGRALPLREYYRRRLLRIYPPYAVALVFSIAVGFLIQNTSPVSPGDVAAHIFLMQGFIARDFNSINVVLWTISIELAFYVLYPAFYYLRTKRSLPVALSFALIISAISIAYFSAQRDVTLPGLYCVFNLWFAWCCGAYLADKKVLGGNDLSKPYYKIIYAAIFVAFVFFKLPFLSRFVIINYQFNILIWTAPLLLLISQENRLTEKTNAIIKILVRIGLSSYSLYLLHVPLIALNSYSAHRFLPPALQGAAILTGILVIPVIAWYSYQYIEKPFMGRKPERIANA